MMRTRSYIVLLLVLVYCVNFAHKAAIFLGAELLERSGASATEVQAVAAVAWLPLLAGGPVAGRLRDNSRALTIFSKLVVVLIVAAVYALAVQMFAGLHSWVYVLAAAMGLGQCAIFLFLRPLLFELAGVARATKVFSVENLGAAGAAAFAPLLFGLVLTKFDEGVAIGVLIVVLLLTSGLVRLAMSRRASVITSLGSVARSSEVPPPSAAKVSFRQLAVSRGFLAIFILTIVGNLLYSPTMSIIPVLASSMNYNSTMSGVLTAAPGFGMIVGSLLIYRQRRLSLGTMFYTGLLTSFVMTASTAMAQTSAFSFAFLFIGGVGLAGWSVTQTPLVMSSTSPERSRAALGWTATAIGVIPLGGIVSGLWYDSVGVRRGLLSIGLAGAVLTIGCVRYYAALRRDERSRRSGVTVMAAVDEVREATG